MQFPLSPSPFTAFPGGRVFEKQDIQTKARYFYHNAVQFILPFFVSTFWSRGQQKEQPWVQTPGLARIKNPVQCFDA